MIKLVSDWKQAWKYLSVWLAGMSAAALELYELFPKFQAYIPDSLFHHGMSVLVALIIVGRLIRQAPK